MSVIYPPNNLARGYTLLEMLVVLVILGLMSGVVGPRIWTQIRVWRESSMIRDVADQIRHLPFEAYSRGHGFHFASEKQARQLLGSLPSDWQVQVITPFRVQANGVCEPGRFAFTVDERTHQIEVQAPLCRTVIHGQ
ncbi:MAG: prepilin-type N-terminal cleavage/methylation domain-containing protein [Gammaproteobacteria bacterium]|nr:prepilin-type N-terminal cleavage/methylation domain-containing protein [Gammaproteobacteria bacterium]